LLVGIIVLAVVLAVVFTYVNRYSGGPEETPNTGQPTTSTVDILSEYTNKIVYTTDTSENEIPYRQHCEERGGNFDACGTVCEPGAEICAEVCAYTCTFTVTNAPDSPDGSVNNGSFPNGFSPVSQWQEYTNTEIGFSLLYPNALMVKNPVDGSVAFTYSGPTQDPNTEFFDGISLTIAVVDTTDYESLNAYVREQITDVQAIGELINPVSTTTFAGRRAYEYSADTLGVSHHRYVFLSPTSTLHISYVAPDPENRGYATVVETMLETFSFFNQ